MSNLAKLFSIVIFVLVLALNSLFIVNQTQYAIVLQFGEYVRTVSEPGLNIRIPFIQSIVKIDNRLLSYDLPPRKVTLGDQKFLVVDAYTRYKVVDPLKFYRAVRDEAKAQNRLVPIVMGGLQSALGQTTLTELLSEKRQTILANIVKKIREDVREFGIEVVDVRIKKADLPDENSKAIFGRMRSDREREAKRLRAEGEEAALKIRAEADRDAVTILSEGKRKALEIEGKAEASAANLLTAAYGKDRKIFEFLQKMNLIRDGVDENTPMYLSTDMEPLKSLKTRPAN